MNEQKSENIMGMDMEPQAIGLDELFGSTLPPQIDLGDSFVDLAAGQLSPAQPASQPLPAAQVPDTAVQAAQPVQTQSEPVVQLPVQGTSDQPVPQAAASVPPQPAEVVQLPVQPAVQTAPPAQAAPVPAQPAGQITDLFGAVAAEDDPAALLAALAGRPPVFVHGSLRDEISDPEMTFEQLRVKMAADIPELEDRSHVSWSVSYGGVTERVSHPDTETVFAVKSKIEKGKKFKDALKKHIPGDKEPACTVKPQITAQKKGVMPFTPYKGLYLSMEEAEASDSAIAYVASQDGRLYELRRNEIGSFIAPAKYIHELDSIQPGFEMRLPRLPAAMLHQIISFFRRVCREHGSEVEALVNVLWDRQEEKYLFHVPPQRVAKASVETDMSVQPDPDRYLHVMDVHSHNTMPARFSKTDDEDEQAVRLYMVIGRLDRYFPEIRCRFACGGRHVEIPAELVFEQQSRPFDRSWLRAVSFSDGKAAA